MESTDYLPNVLWEFRRLKETADGAIRQVTDNYLFEVVDSRSNSIAVLLKHMAGNLRSRWTDFLISDGEKPGRDRDSEFVTAGGDTKAHLLQDWEAGWPALFDTLRSLGTGDLSITVTIRGERHSVIEAINRQLTHYGYHVGQIVFLAKHWAGEDWQTLTIKEGKSREFNRSPGSYKREV